MSTNQELLLTEKQKEILEGFQKWLEREEKAAKRLSLMYMMSKGSFLKSKSNPHMIFRAPL
ncbi:hypothetical protein [Bacillus piscicola]|uniref:hypothetical protein n=1 Tax=Bacillus piscicola TaxID=1632684 RepID=UPI001F092E30|nr:hypothetical protein [Bacillus piscicola]